MRRIALTLHAHLPFYPPELDQPNLEAGAPHFGSHWLFENTIECYLPLLKNLKRLEDVSGSTLNISFSPVLLEQLASSKTRHLLGVRLADRIDRARSDARRFQGLLKEQALTYEREFSGLLKFYEAINRDIIGEFSRLSNVELMTTALTHPFLPLLKYHESVCAFQVSEAAKLAARKMGRRVRGFWFPEMGYTPYLRDVVSNNFDYFLVTPAAVPAWEGNAYQNRLGARFGVVDPRVSGSIWHPPGLRGKATFARNPGYREFYRWDDTSGLKYWASTGEDVPLAEKVPYSANAAAEEIEKDVSDCLELLSALRSDRLLGIDAEFFGHHWYEGSVFLYLLLKHSEQHGVQFVRNSDIILDPSVEAPEIEPCESCWGTDQVWMGPGKIADIRTDILVRTEEALSLFRVFRNEKEHYRTMLLNRLLREVLVIQASDYAFAVYTDRASQQYDRLMAHHRESFDALAREIIKTCSYCERQTFLPTLRRIARVNYLFRDMDYKALGC
jgi:1,4-alpha-glucan branching enzyme